MTILERNKMKLTFSAFGLQSYRLNKLQPSVFDLPAFSLSP
jgi:hypothetical protein